MSLRAGPDMPAPPAARVPAARDGPATRDRILGLVRTQPGLHKMAVCRALGLSWGTVSYHVRRLVRAREISANSPRGREVRLFAAGVDEQQRRWITALRDGLDPALVDHLDRAPDSGLAQMSEALNVSRRIIQRHLGLLDQGGLLMSDGRWRAKYRLNEEADRFRRTTGELGVLAMPGPEGDSSGPGLE